MKQNLKTKLITLVLTFALAVTGVSFNNLATAQAAQVKDDGSKYVLVNCEDNSDIEGKTVTMKPGDAMSFEYRYYYGSISMRLTDTYEWTCSDDSIVTMNIQYYKTPAGNPSIDWIELYANKPGTVTITGTGTFETGTKTISFTIVVKEAEKTATMTAKQKKCKHAWKTTRKATCMRNGMKACKKCKLEKVIKQKAHKFVTKEETRDVYQTYPIYACQSCACKDEFGNKVHPNDGFDRCTNLCGEEFDAMDYDTDSIITKEDVDAAYEAYRKHQADDKHGTGSISEIEGYCNPKPVTKTVTRCKSCGMTPEQIKNAGQ